ncbi:TlpA disulfide reductase family protein [Winogradskyella luteola]|uniref:AhpC/TSA family protein n=1 Tax=Winogradskyella luteola TaxID=2828330 RepID=A0A9X1FB99_9FLAO|nr:TlpA disulfide reductase family protein [Winogradskyella luteola]MBV7270691.1 AhpC/TSA family protein [Winogradskyella luteola]
MIKKLTYTAILIFIVFSCSKLKEEPQSQYYINGLVKETKNGSYQDYIYMSYGSFKDSALVDKNGKFEFKGQLKYPTRAYLYLKDPSASVGFYIENSDIYLSGQFYKSNQNNTNYNLFYIDSVSGSKSNELVAKFRKFKKENKSKPNFDNLVADHLTELAYNNPKNSIVGTLVADEAIKGDKIFNLAQLKKIYAYLDSSFQLKSEIEVIERGILQLEKSKLGDPFINFTITGTKSDSLKFKQLLGKKILIDFWASWCQPCIKKHPAMIDLYKRMNKNNFEIVSISIDKSKQNWLKGLEKEKLPWKNGLDESEFIANSYGINAIPFNYLLNETGEIIAINKSLEEIERIILEK